MLQQRIDVLDGWRALAVGLVVVSHLATAAHPLGAIGVDIFFVISGFVICRGLLNEAASSKISFAGFYIRRAFRILPPLAFYIIAIDLLDRYGIIRVESGSVFEGFTFTCNFQWSDCGGWYGGQLWSLSVEEQFYLVIPALLALMIALKRQPLLSIALLILPILTMALYSVGWGAAGKFVLPFNYIAFGVVWALNEKAVLLWLDRIPRILMLVPVGTIIFAVAVLGGSRLSTTLFVLALPPALTIMLAMTLLPSPFVATVFTARPLVEFGRASYSFYLWQQFAIGISYGNKLATFAALVAALLFSLLSFNAVERRLINIGRELANYYSARTTHLA